MNPNGDLEYLIRRAEQVDLDCGKEGFEVKVLVDTAAGKMIDVSGPDRDAVLAQARACLQEWRRETHIKDSDDGAG